jgi:hypothetical protein
MTFMKVIAAVMILSLAGCATDPRIVAFEAGKKKVNVDKRVLMECEELKKIEDPTTEKMLEATEQWMKSYRECRVWKNELNRIVKDAFNID